MSTLRPDLNGYRIKFTASDTAIYLVLDGQACHIPDPTTYNLLFENWDGIQIVPDIQTGPSLSEGASLVKLASEAAIYLVSNSTKRWIKNMEVFDRYDFNSATIYEEQRAIMLDSIATGAELQ